MVGVEHDIERCYRQIAARSGDVAGFRDCMTLDYTAYNIDQVDGRQINEGRCPSSQTMLRRGEWRNTAPLRSSARPRKCSPI